MRFVDGRLDAIERQLVQAGRESATVRHLITAPGYGPILPAPWRPWWSIPPRSGAARTSPPRSASRPRQEGTGGKTWLGPISKRGNGYLRRLLVNGATAVLKSKRAKTDPWLAKLLAAKPRKVVAVALANKMARIGWNQMTRQEDYREGERGGLRLWT